MLSKIEELEIKEWFTARSKYKENSVLWKTHHDELGRRLKKKLAFFIRTCQCDWNRRFHIDSDECESMLCFGLIKAMNYYGKNKKGIFTGRFKSNFTSFFYMISKQMLYNYLVKINYPMSKNKKSKGVKKRIPPSLLKSINRVPLNSNNSLHVKSDSQDQEQEFDMPLFMTDPLENDSNTEFLQTIFSKCSFQEKKVLALLHKGHSLTVVAQKLNRSRQRISAILVRIKEHYTGLAKQYGI